VLAPREDGDEPWVFIEVQFQPDENLYRRLFAEIFLFLHRAPKARPWRALILYSDAQVERIPSGYANLLELSEIHRVDISCHRGENRDTTGWELLRLIVDDGTAAVARAQRLIQAQSASGPGAKPARAMLDDLVNFIETVLVYKLPHCTREEIQTMIGLTDIDLKQTRFYQDVLAEGQSLGENQLLLRQIRHRFGSLPEWVEDKLSQSSMCQKELWADRIFNAPSLEVLFAQSGE
jgi:predicted transposase YdaD